MFYTAGTAPVTTPWVSTRLLLVGDGGEVTSESPVLDALERRAAIDPMHTLILFLGDNIYDKGLPTDTKARDYEEAAMRLQLQIDAVMRSKANGIVVPGNHDWNYSGNFFSNDGKERIKAQEEFVRKEGKKMVRFLPTGALPGPVCEDFGVVRLVVLDTQAWLQANDPKLDEAQVLEDLRECITTAGSREVVVVGHHPLQTRGTHGGYYTWRHHFFPATELWDYAYIPTPIVGSLYPLIRNLGVSDQDLSGSANEHLVSQLHSVFEQKPPLVYASGHEHSLQIERGAQGSQFHIVSGAGSKKDEVRHDDRHTLFAQESLGFVELEFNAANHVVATVHSESSAGDVTASWRYVLK